MRKPPLPKEHGAWGILLGAFFSVVAITGKFNFNLVLFLIAIVLFYFSRHIFLQIWRVKSSSSDWIWFFIFVVFGWGFLITLAILANYWLVVPISFFMALFLLIEILLIRAKKQRSFPAQMIGTIGLTSIAPLSFMLLQKKILWEAGFIWMINILFFCSGILYVRYQIALMKKNTTENAELNKYRISVICYHFLLLIILLIVAVYNKFYPGLVLAFIPTILQATTAITNQFTIKTIKRLGWLEIAHTLVFVIILGCVL